MIGRLYGAQVTAVDRLQQELTELNMDAVLQTTEQLLRARIPSGEIFAVLRQGLDRVNDRCEAGRYFIADLIMANNIFREAVNRITSFYSTEKAGAVGRVLMGTVQGDIHELGKNLISIILRNSGFEIVDLGADVSPERFCAAVLTHVPDVLILSGTLSGSDRRMAETIRVIERAGIRGTVRIILGGGCIDEKRALQIGADAYSKELPDCLRLCRRFIQEKE